MVRDAIAILTLLLLAAALIALIRADAFSPAPTYALVLLLLLSLLAVGDLLAKRVKGWRQDVRTRRLVFTHPAGQDLAQRLMGDYPPYVVEAAEEIEARGAPGDIPLIGRALDRLIVERPPGWREMAGAMAAALGRIGDPAGLSLLGKLAATRGAEEIEGLPQVIASLENTALLLRSAPEPADQELLRAAESRPDSDPALLLRAPSDHGDA